MKSVSRFLCLCAAFAAMFLTGCAITPPVTSTKNDAVRLACTTATPGVDGVAVTACAIDAQDINKDTGGNVSIWKRSVHMFQSLPTLGEVAKGVTGGTGAAWLQGEALKDATKLGKCADGANCGNVFNLQSSSGAASQSLSETNSTLGVNTGGAPAPCGAACATTHAK